MSTTSSKNNWLIPIAFTNIYVIWGITFLAISFGLQGFPPFILSGFRFLVAGILILGYLSAKGEKANSLGNWKKNGITGILILTGGTGLVAWGEQYVTASEAAITIATGPFWFIAIDKKNWKYYFSDKFIPIGLIIGFIGLILFLKGSVSANVHHAAVSDSVRVTAFVVLALSSVAWVLGSLYSKKNPASQSTFMNIAQQLIIAGVASFVIAFFRNEWNNFSLTTIPLSAWLGVLFLIFFGSIIAYLSYIWLLSVKPAALVSTHTYINPIVTVLAGWIIANQTINGNQLFGLTIILAGVLLTNITKYFKLSKRSKVKIRRVLRFAKRNNRPYQPI
ncbi:EamA family transporter [Chryseobacterium sp. PTM-20240506]|uniref:EamA family transporter n=1 Tax=unclassified Chryseobacterium TaxID=2593645 RepID=UPI0023587092|nr:MULTISPECIES: EamA family transporter [unclassified Chryseobacterium]MDC8104681.1 EamA family transporter [Chryseobacterium sp. B21-037]MDQ1806221.1 EamA family transporter [Chryseobacterium sp. CKR4-1]